MRLDVIGKQGLAEQLSLPILSAKFEHTDSHICCEKMPKTTFGRTAPWVLSIFSSSWHLCGVVRYSRQCAAILFFFEFSFTFYIIGELAPCLGTQDL
jgi:hypothetical protein